jgi:hypothetical protein
MRQSKNMVVRLQAIVPIGPNAGSGVADYFFVTGKFSRGIRFFQSSTRH